MKKATRSKKKKKNDQKGLGVIDKIVDSLERNCVEACRMNQCPTDDLTMLRHFIWYVFAVEAEGRKKK